jgi:hypothetical protein
VRRAGCPAVCRLESLPARDLQLFLAPLHVDSSTLRVVPVDERVGKRLTECGLGIGGYRHAKHSELQLFLPVPGLEPGEHLLGESQQGVREKSLTSTSRPRRTWKAAS